MADDLWDADATFDSDLYADNPERRHWRDQVRGLLEEYAHNIDDADGVITHFVILAEFASSNWEDQWDDGVTARPERTFYMDYADANGWTSVPWAVKGLLQQGLDSLKNMEE